mmetsp:Transcript_142490/g.355151  ORF Transcript_142490/g.355151 Transcript_142490/m.355151 type:complete len:214 (-) Transcript_142490:2414-3055(-)
MTRARQTVRGRTVSLGSPMRTEGFLRSSTDTCRNLAPAVATVSPNMGVIVVRCRRWAISPRGGTLWWRDGATRTDQSSRRPYRLRCQATTAAQRRHRRRWQWLGPGRLAPVRRRACRQPFCRHRRHRCGRVTLRWNSWAAATANSPLGRAGRSRLARGRAMPAPSGGHRMDSARCPARAARRRTRTGRARVCGKRTRRGGKSRARARKRSNAA